MSARVDECLEHDWRIHPQQRYANGQAVAVCAVCGLMRPHVSLGIKLTITVDGQEDGTWVLFNPISSSKSGLPSDLLAEAAREAAEDFSRQMYRDHESIDGKFGGMVLDAQKKYADDYRRAWHEARGLPFPTDAPDPTQA